MLKRIILLFLVLSFFPTFASCEPPTPSELATISQFDEAFDSFRYDYWGTSFKYTGCGPASVTNALIASLGITDADVASSLTLDILHVLTHYSETEPLVFSRIQWLALPEKRRVLDTANGVLNHWGGTIRFSDSTLSAHDVLTAASDASSTLLIGSVIAGNRWQFLCETAHSLYNSGHSSASICIAMLAAGTSSSGAPFQSGDAGHYVTLYVPVRSFCEEGTVYLIDSLPRALSGEEFNPDDAAAAFRHPYLFNPMSTRSYIVQEFRDRCTVERVSLTMLRITPTHAFGEMTLAQAGSAAISTYDQYLKTFGFFSDGKAFIHIPKV